MASFVQDLWESIFTPGPTASLLKATNVSFAALQVVLLALLIATYSIHFVVLSFLCGGLWWAVNWFATELSIHQAREEREKARATRDAAATEDSETEVETIVPIKPAAKSVSASREVEPVEAAGELKHRAAAEASTGTQSSASTEDEWEKVSENENEKDK